jgi:hypothetical protein
MRLYEGQQQQLFLLQYRRGGNLSLAALFQTGNDREGMSAKSPETGRSETYHHKVYLNHLYVDNLIQLSSALLRFLK